MSNLNLYRLGRAAGLGEMMVASKFEPHDNWLPPCYRDCMEKIQNFFVFFKDFVLIY